MLKSKNDFSAASIAVQCVKPMSVLPSCRKDTALLIQLPANESGKGPHRANVLQPQLPI